jgi:hypothetical protein
MDIVIAIIGLALLLPTAVRETLDLIQRYRNR